MIIAMSRAESSCNARHEWLLDDKYKNWVTKDRSGNQRHDSRCVLIAAKFYVFNAIL